jgi:hypothetical protein
MLLAGKPSLGHFPPPFCLQRTGAALHHFFKRSPLSFIIHPFISSKKHRQDRLLWWCFLLFLFMQ